MSHTNLENLPDTDRWLAETFCSGLTEVLEMMTGEKPGILVRDSGGQADSMLWWEQPFSVSPEAVVWIGCGEPGWSSLAGKALKAAGIEEAEKQDIRQTYVELLQQSLAAFGQALGAKIGRDVNSEEGRETDDAPPVEAIPIEVRFSESESCALSVAFSDVLTGVSKETETEARQRTGQDKPTHDSPAVATEPQASNSPTQPMELLLDVELPVSVSFGRAHLALKDVLKLTSGSIVELNRPVAEPVEVIVNNCVLARGEVVVVDGNYGVRISQIISRKERFRTLN